MQSITVGRSDETFLLRYARPISLTTQAIDDFQPDLIVAMTRKAPRLLELLQATGRWSAKAPIVTQRALRFMAPDELQGKKIAVFDDTIISGTTVYNFLTQLHERAPTSELRVFCIALDREIIATRPPPGSSEYAFHLAGARVQIVCPLVLDTAQRFAFCHAVVTSLPALGKPYDSDHPIFYLAAEHSLFPPADEEEWFDLTTIAHERMGQERRTAIQTVGLRDWLLGTIGKDLTPRCALSKVRLYMDRARRRTAVVPMVLLSKNSSIQDHAPHLAAVLSDQILARLGIQDDEARLRLEHYLVCYYYGAAWLTRRLADRDRALWNQEGLPLQLADLSLLFGPTASRLLLEALRDEWPRLRDSLANRSGPRPDVELAATGAPSPLGPQSKQTYLTIKSYLDSHLRPTDSLPDQMAAIFEGMVVNIEVPEEARLRMEGLYTNDDVRLRRGFTFPEILSVLGLHGIDVNDRQLPLKASLALDLLVDQGTIVPFFRVDGTSFDRAFRHGEEGLSARQFEFLMAAVTDDLFVYQRRLDSGREDLPKIAYEKIAVLVRESIRRLGLVDLLRGRVDHSDRELSIDEDFQLFGKVLVIGDETGSRKETRYFVNWARDQGFILHKGEENVARNPAYTKHHGAAITIFAHADQVGTLKMVARMALHAYVASGNQGTRRLIGLTSCTNWYTYLQALQAEARLFYKGGPPFLEDVEGLFDQPSDKNPVRIATASRAVGALRKVAHQGHEKKKLWTEMPGIVNSLKETFQRDLALDVPFLQNLGPHLDTILEGRAVHPRQSAIDAVRKPLEDFIELTSAFAYVLGCAEAILGEIPDPREASKLANSLETWNKTTADAKRRATELTPFGGLPQAPSLATNEPGEVSRALAPWFTAACNVLATIYNQAFAEAGWKKQMQLLFPDETEIRRAGAQVYHRHFFFAYDIKDSSVDKALSAIAKKQVNLDLRSGGAKTPHSIVDTTTEMDDKNIYSLDIAHSFRCMRLHIEALAKHGFHSRGVVTSLEDCGDAFLVVEDDPNRTQNTVCHTLLAEIMATDKDKDPHYTLTVTHRVLREWAEKNGEAALTLGFGPDWQVTWVQPIGSPVTWRPKDDDLVEGVRPPPGALRLNRKSGRSVAVHRAHIVRRSTG